MTNKTKLYNKYLVDAYCIDATLRLIETTTDKLRKAYYLGELSEEIQDLFLYYCEISDDVDEEITNYRGAFYKLYNDLFKNDVN